MSREILLKIGCRAVRSKIKLDLGTTGESLCDDINDDAANNPPTLPVTPSTSAEKGVTAKQKLFSIFGSNKKTSSATDKTNNGTQDGLN